jgi:tetratricopeptide (TPR) repeat protein
MDRNITGKRPTFRQTGPQLNFYRVLVWLVMILGGAWLVSQIGIGPDYKVQPMFLATPTATRTADSYLMAAEAYFNAGKVDDPEDTDAIDAYRMALALEPNNAIARAELARLLTYSTGLLSTSEERAARLEQALEESTLAVELAPDDSNVQAIHALVLDWNAGYAQTADENQALLVKAEQQASMAYLRDPNNALALAIYAEVLLDQGKLAQAAQHAQQAVDIAPDLMDTHRVNGLVLETLGQYRVAIEEYEKAAAIYPNLTFLYIRIGVIYRELQVYDVALEQFAKAIRINEANGVQDPIPYIAIAKTYSRMGEFFVAALNGEKALNFDPTDANTYGQLGDIYVRSRNYEGAMPVLKCAVLGCIADENEVGGFVPVEGLPLNNVEVAFYYVRYGSVLAALSRPGLNYCPEALSVLAEVRRVYGDNDLLMGIVLENEAICRLLQETPVP